ncbi:pilus assembly protein N-terminal domain-containing protein [Capnocytophaga sp.]|uniref:Ig-like domain-containing protein n=1 Tax=Capnocytophaga sp. TaxID=44737 RepID=UPI0026DA8902|nr:pilus assembly protein N-terminal domain-containing protein [Capnocytophaga sp.]MDO5104723.1 pilus assembly protein N-terminal domain-containing protein [Capnocytophaga sp.]
MKNFKFMYGVLALFLIAVGCGKDNETPTEVINELKTEATELIITEKESKSVKITSGNGAYKVASSDDKVATATVKDNTVSVEAKKAGTAKITLSDSKNKSLTINVMVDALIALEDLQQPVTLKIGAEKTISIKSGTGTYKVVTDNDNISVSNENNTLKIVAKKAGNSKITITDTKTNKTLVVDVVVEHLDLAIAETAVTMALNTSTEIAITAGSGTYDIAVNNDNVTATINENKVIIIQSNKGGNSQITVTDSITKKTAIINVTVSQPDLGVSVSELVITKNTSKTVTITSGSNQYEVTSSNESIATVTRENQTITINGIKEGTTTITVKDTQSNQTKQITVKIVEKLELQRTSLRNLYVKDEAGIRINSGMPTPELCVSENTEIAVFERIGKMGDDNYIFFRGKKQGTTIVRVSDGTTTINVNITVLPVVNMTINENELTTLIDEIQTITITGSGKYTFAVANPEIAQIGDIENTGGNSLYTYVDIKGLKAGETTITITQNSTNISKTIKIIVEEEEGDE